MFWRQGNIVKNLKQPKNCNHFDVDKNHRLLAVANADGVSLVQLDLQSDLQFVKIKEEKIGSTEMVRFNDNATKLVAITSDGSVYEIVLQ